ncbi:MAG: signal peptidase II, partial [Oscillospiraceae bacterium]
MLLISIEVLLLVFADRITKILAETFLVAGNMIPVIPGVVGLELLEGGNTGAAFGILRENRLALIILPLIVSCALLYMLFFMKIRSKLLKYSVIMILAGGLGNLYDRIFGGVVVDFIKFIFFEFPTFNFADCCIS